MMKSFFETNLHERENKSLAESANNFRKLLNRFSYKKNISWEVKEWQYPYSFSVVFRVMTDCSKSGERVEIQHHKTLDRMMLLKWGEDHLKQMIIQWFREIEQHEFDEFLKFDGEMLNDPHKDDFKKND